MSSIKSAGEFDPVVPKIILKIAFEPARTMLEYGIVDTEVLKIVIFHSIYNPGVPKNGSSLLKRKFKKPKLFLLQYLKLVFL